MGMSYVISDMRVSVFTSPQASKQNVPLCLWELKGEISLELEWECVEFQNVPH